MRRRAPFKDYLLRSSIKLLNCEFQFKGALESRNQQGMPLVKLICPLISFLVPLAFGGGLPGKFCLTLKTGAVFSGRLRNVTLRA
jgi:hypothetical protein